MNVKPAVLKNFVFERKVCFLSPLTYQFQNLVGLELPIKRTTEMALISVQKNLKVNVNKNVKISIKRYDARFFLSQ